jgi:hypothetical protein
MRTRLFLAPIIALAGACIVPAWAQQVEPVPNARAQQVLKSFIPPNQKTVTINAYVAGSGSKTVDRGMGCSFSSNANQLGGVNSSGGCVDLHNYFEYLFSRFS